MVKSTLVSRKTELCVFLFITIIIIYVLILVNLISICLDLMENLTKDFTPLKTSLQSLSRLNMLTQLVSFYVLLPREGSWPYPQALD
jgi:hypothetical protein